jgi:3D (Asp-Asp-Asp) domain-containing protein
MVAVTATGARWFIDVQVPPAVPVESPASPAGSQVKEVIAQAGSAERRPAAVVREVTAYNLGVREQTSGEPCIGATGRNLCRLAKQGLKICAANFVEPDTVLNIEGYGECVVLDRMNRRYAHRVDIAMQKDQVDEALEFGIQRRLVEVRREPR